MESCPNCENQVEQEQIVCPVCGMILKDINIYSNFISNYMICCLVVFLIAFIINFIGLLIIFFY
ncbi:MAG: hypothetical protein ACFFCL_10100 [Promethearchaeota archaeon]